jgi:nucleoside-diphosphate-sugar epimerase
MKKVLITGGAGYVGSRLTPQLLKLGYHVTILDKMFYGQDCLPSSNSNLKILTADLRRIKDYRMHFKDVEAVIHLGCISNDASFELNESLSRTINFDSFEPLVILAKEAGVKRFIYASSSSVYGVSTEKNVTENHPLLPLTLYNKYKGLCEPLLFKHQTADFVCVAIRPATLCGYSPRQRLDLTVNILTNWAINRRKINVFGGSQLRPNLHIQDMCDLYVKLLTETNDKISGQTFNVGYQNMSVMNIALLVKKIVEQETPKEAEISIEQSISNDLRSYHINSEKIKTVIGFEAQYTVEDAVRELCNAFKTNKLPSSFDDDRYFNVRQMKAVNAT